jgi:hypothetical protein
MGPCPRDVAARAFDDVAEQALAVVDGDDRGGAHSRDLARSKPRIDRRLTPANGVLCKLHGLGELLDLDQPPARGAAYAGSLADFVIAKDAIVDALNLSPSDFLLSEPFQVLPPRFGQHLHDTSSPLFTLRVVVENLLRPAMPMARAS